MLIIGLGEEEWSGEFACAYSGDSDRIAASRVKINLCRK